jgi:hypothetical protein
MNLSKTLALTSALVLSGLAAQAQQPEFGPADAEYTY